MWAWEPARLSFLVQSTYDMFPSPADLVRWKISKEDKCHSGQCGTLRHILSACPLSLKDRYTWRHNQVLRVIVDAMETKVNEINQGKLPVKNFKGKVKSKWQKKKAKWCSIKKGKKGVIKQPPKKQMVEEKWLGSCKIAAGTYIVFFCLFHCNNL